MSIQQSLLLMACEEGRDDMLKRIVGNVRLASNPLRPIKPPNERKRASVDAACNLNPPDSTLRSTDGSAYMLNINEPILVPGKWGGSRLVHVAAAQGHLDCLRRLIEVLGAEFDPRDPRGCTPTFLAAHHGHESIVRYLLTHKPNPDAVNYEGLSPLCMACSRGHLSIVEVLLDGGADIHLSGKDQRCPLHLAAASGHLEVVNELIGRGASLYMTENAHSYTPLHLAASNGYHNVVSLLISKGANVEAKDRHGDTPLHLAARHNRPEMIKILIREGKADALARNDKGRTPLAEAEASFTRTAACVGLLQRMVEEAIAERGFDVSSVIEKTSKGKSEARSSCPGAIEANRKAAPWIPPTVPFQTAWERRRNQPIPMIKRTPLKNERDSYFAPIFSKA
jgi:ankyrin repeat protein